MQNSPCVLPDTDAKKVFFVDESLVLYFDVLGVKGMFSGKSRQEDILTINNLYNAFDDIRNYLKIPQRNGVTASDAIAAALFSDCAYIIAAINPSTDFEGQLYGQFFTIAECQTILLRHKLICRGGIAKGLVAVEDNFLAGPPLSKASKCDESGGFPVVYINEDLLSESYMASCIMRGMRSNPDFCLLTRDWSMKILSATRQGESSPKYFFNYMEDWFANCTDPLNSRCIASCKKVLLENLAMQKSLLEENIKRYCSYGEIQGECHANPETPPCGGGNVLSKYVFLAKVHNFVIETYSRQPQFSDIGPFFVRIKPGAENCCNVIIKAATADLMRLLHIPQAKGHASI